MSPGNEQIVRNAHQIAKDRDVRDRAASFTEDGRGRAESIGVVYRGADEMGTAAEIYATAFPVTNRWR
jgi:hypothetical protein